MALSGFRRLLLLPPSGRVNPTTLDDEKDRREWARPTVFQSNCRFCSVRFRSIGRATLGRATPFLAQLARIAGLRLRPTRPAQMMPQQSPASAPPANVYA